MATVTPELISTVVMMAPEQTSFPLFRMSLDLYNQMGDSGLLTRADRVELLDGLLVRKMTKGPRHVLATYAASKLLTSRLPAGYHCKSEASIELRRGQTGDSAPEPDVSVIRGEATDFGDHHPVAADVLLVVEVADSSLRLDRQGLRRYAFFNIPTTWIINLRSGTVEVYTNPSGPTDDPGYRDKTTRSIGETLELVLDDHRVAGLAVTEMFN